MFQFMLMLIHTDFSLVQILITPPPAIERDDNIGCSTPYSRMTSTPQSGMASTTNRPGVVTPTPGLGLERTPCSQFGVLAIRSPSLDGSCPSGVMDIVQYTQVLIITIYATDIFIIFVSSTPFSESNVSFSAAEFKTRTQYIQVPARGKR